MKNSNSSKHYVKGAQTRQHILTVAKTEFLEKGYLGASIRNIAKIAGVTTGSSLSVFSRQRKSLSYIGVSSSRNRVIHV